MRALFHKSFSFLLMCSYLALLGACSGGGGKTLVRFTPQLKPVVGPGQRLLNQTAQLLSSAKTLHGLFEITLKGPLANGELESEIWRMAPGKSRSLVQKSTLNQFTPGLLEIDDGRKIWQYDPAKNVVYT